MTSEDAFVAIEAVAAAKGKQKEVSLSAYISDPLMVRVLQAALDPFVTYGVKKLPEPNGRFSITGPGVFDERTWGTLEDLAARRLTGRNAMDAISGELSRLRTNSRALLRRILSKDLRAGITAKTVNKVAPGTVQVFECMAAHKFEPARIKQWPMFVEPKYDGVRAIAIYQKGNVKLYSRTGKLFSNFPGIASELCEMVELDPSIRRVRGTHYKRATVFDGELTAAEFRQIVGDVHKKGVEIEGAVYRVFDMMPFDVFRDPSSRNNLPYKERRYNLEWLFASYQAVDEDDHPHFIALPGLHVVNGVDEIMALHSEQLSAGGEGVIVKHPDALYEKKRSYGWLKVKDKQTVDVPVVGWFEGTGKYKGKLGGLIVDVEGVEVRVGTGLSDALRDELWRESMDGGMEEHLVEVAYHEKTPDGSLRHPRFIRFRSGPRAIDEKDPEDGVGV